MSTQIFKNNVPNDRLFSLLESICIKTEKCYIFNTNSFKKSVFNNSVADFINECKPYYHLSKQKYLERKLCYNSFITILRQICNFNNINYTSQIKYDKSVYEIIYYVYF